MKPSKRQEALAAKRATLSKYAAKRTTTPNGVVVPH